MRAGFGNSTSDWISHNLKKKKTSSCRNLYTLQDPLLHLSLENLDSVPYVSSKIRCSYANEIVEAFKSPLISDPSKDRLTPWFPPNTSGLKLNTDGCWYDEDRQAGFGGIFRNEQGNWELGFYGKMMAASSLETETWSIYRGLTIILEKGWINIQIESDSQIAMILFNKGANTNHPQSNILNDGKYLLNRTGSNLVRIYRGANQCADYLARLGAEQNEELVVTRTSPGY